MNIKSLEKAVDEYNKANENDKRILIHIAPRTISVTLSDSVDNSEALESLLDYELGKDKD